MENVYTMTQINEAWELYKSSSGWRVLKDGKWKFYRETPQVEGATRCEYCKVKNSISFPKFLLTTV